MLEINIFSLIKKYNTWWIVRKKKPCILHKINNFLSGNLPSSSIWWYLSYLYLTDARSLWSVAVSGGRKEYGWGHGSLRKLFIFSAVRSQYGFTTDPVRTHLRFHCGFEFSVFHFTDCHEQYGCYTDWRSIRADKTARVSLIATDAIRPHYERCGLSTDPVRMPRFQYEFSTDAADSLRSVRTLYEHFFSDGTQNRCGSPRMERPRRSAGIKVGLKQGSALRCCISKRTHPLPRCMEKTMIPIKMNMTCCCIYCCSRRSYCCWLLLLWWSKSRKRKKFWQGARGCDREDSED